MTCKLVEHPLLVASLGRSWGARARAWAIEPADVWSGRCTVRRLNEAASRSSEHAPLISLGKNLSAPVRRVGDDAIVTERDHAADAQPAEFLLDGYPPAIRTTGRALRSLILRTVPGAVETVRPGWRWVAYSLPEKGRVRNFAWIGPERKHIHLGFEHGVLLADPEHLLKGAQERLRKFRYFTFEPTIDIDEAILVDYVRRAAKLALLPAAERRALADDDAELVAPDDIELVLVAD